MNILDNFIDKNKNKFFLVVSFEIYEELNKTNLLKKDTYKGIKIIKDGYIPYNIVYPIYYTDKIKII
jgi:hypothetical protein